MYLKIFNFETVLLFPRIVIKPTGFFTRAVS